MKRYVLYAVLYMLAATSLLVLGGFGYAGQWYASLCLYTAGVVIGIGATRAVLR